MACERYQQEQAFTDSAAERVLSALPQNLQAPNLNTFEELCSGIHYLQSAPAFLGNLSGKRVLEMGCGNGWISLRFAQSGANVWACDISGKMIELARRYALAAGVDIRFDQLACEELAYADEFFDCVFIHMALHHCDIPATVREVRRVLKSGGKAVFVEDYAYHPLMRIYRALTPRRHTEQERPLTKNDVDYIASVFPSFSCEYYGLFSIFKYANNRWVRLLKRVLEAIDALLYMCLPPLKKYSQVIVIEIVKE